MTTLNIDRKWIMVEPSMVKGEGYPPPSPTSPWVNNTFINDCRLLRATKYHILSPSLSKDKADVYFLITCINSHLEEEIEFAKRVRREGSKIVLAISADGRFSSGQGLMCSSSGFLYTDLCQEVDVICSGVSSDVHIYGSSQHKVVEVGEFVEQLNFSTTPFNNRTIDMLGTGFVDEASLSFSIVFFLMLKERYPNKRFVYAFRADPQYDMLYELVSKRYPQIEFSRKDMPSLLNQSKAYSNLEPRVRGGRALLEAWYHRVPSIGYSQTYFSKLYPEFAFSNMSFDNLVNIYERMLNSDYEYIIQKAGDIISYDSAENVYERIINKLDGK